MPADTLQLMPHEILIQKDLGLGNPVASEVEKG